MEAPKAVDGSDRSEMEEDGCVVHGREMPSSFMEEDKTIHEA